MTTEGITGIIEDRVDGKDFDPPAKNKKEPLANYFSFRFTMEKVGSWDHLLRALKDEWTSARFQLEQGEKGQKHYQGVIHVKTRKRASQLQLWALDTYPDLKFPHLDYLKRSYMPKKADAYVMKTESRIDGPWEFGMPVTLDIIKDDMLYPWQLDIVKIIEEEPDRRTIRWYWGGYGIGKTQFCKYLSYKYGAIPLEGEKKHMLAVAAQHQTCKIFIIPLCKDDDKPSYRAIEKIKDGYFMSHFGTEQTKPVIMNSPHILIFANAPPNEEDKGFHPDKYVITQIYDGLHY